MYIFLYNFIIFSGDIYDYELFKKFIMVFLYINY